ncbi:MAG: exonuclease domain-containing protein [Micropruina sp.]
MPAPDLPAMTTLTSQPTFDDLGTPLSQVTFCVVDLETTGGGADDEITEIGAVKVAGGEVLGEFQTLVNPSTHIPPLISVLTGITDSMVAGAPSLASVLPSFLEFAAGSALVAHNASFDVGFLKRACAGLDYAWPNPVVVNTVALARQALLRDEVRNHKLATLAQHFHAETPPNHRALTDARATVTVLHGLLERVGNLGVHTVEDLVEFTRRVSPQRRAKRTWAAGLPASPGVYWFVADGRDAAGGPAARCSTWGRAATCGPGSAAISPPPRPGRESTRWYGWPPASSI